MTGIVAAAQLDILVTIVADRLVIIAEVVNLLMQQHVAGIALFISILMLAMMLCVVRVYLQVAAVLDHGLHYAVVQLGVFADQVAVPATEQ